MTGNSSLIQRQDHRSTHGYYVRVKRAHVVVGRFFGDRAFGGRSNALAAARTYRNAVVAQLPPPVLMKQRNVRNTTGIMGVCRVRGKRGKSAAWPLDCFVATWPWPPRGGRKVKRSFS